MAVQVGLLRCSVNRACAREILTLTPKRPWLAWTISATQRAMDEDRSLQAEAGKSRVRARTDSIRDFRCKNLIAVIEDPQNPRNIGTVIRNVNALGVEKVYVVDPRGVLPNDWDAMREEPKLAKLSVSAVKWTFVRRFASTAECLSHLEANRFVSMVTSPHVKGQANSFLHECDFSEHAKLTIWFGNETRGISELAIERSARCVFIPMFGMVESLNLGTSSGIVLYEVNKQRRAYQSQFRLRDRRGKRLVPLPVTMTSDG
jgi:tRNA (guanosine-2'-O-)-methyltransferase